MSLSYKPCAYNAKPCMELLSAASLNYVSKTFSEEDRLCKPEHKTAGVGLGTASKGYSLEFPTPANGW